MSNRTPPPRPVSQESKQARCIAEADRLAKAGRHYEAIGVIQPLLKKARPDAQVLFVAAALCEMTLHFDDAIAYANRSLAQVAHADTLRLVARCCVSTWRTDQALAACDRADALDPGNPQTRFIRGDALERGGRFDEALAVVEPLVRSMESRNQPLDAELAVLWGKILVNFKRYGEAVTALEAVEGQENVADDVRVEAFHTTAKALDRSKQFPAAFEAARSANAIGQVEFQPEVYEQQVSVLIENWSREKMQKFPTSSCQSEVPIFVAGMPRSGTSLIDQIVDAHPRAAGVGELATIDGFAREVAAAWDPDLEPPESFGHFDSRRWTQTAEKYLREVRKLAPGAERIVNKSLGNNRLVGLIARLFPNTRIIHAIRDPRDVAISCFMGNFNNSKSPYTTRIDWVSAAWQQSMRMMDHWKSALDVPILDVYYENLVRSPETEFPRIIEFLGLDWDDACNEFYKSKRVVRTLSYDQVNRPVYTSSAGRHANYAEFFEGIDFPTYQPTA